MTSHEERIFELGGRAAHAHHLQLAVQHLGPDGDLHRWRLERAAAVAALRRICEKFGDNDWPDDLHLADVLEKHLERSLYDEKAV